MGAFRFALQFSEALFEFHSQTDRSNNSAVTFVVFITTHTETLCQTLLPLLVRFLVFLQLFSLCHCDRSPVCISVFFFRLRSLAFSPVSSLLKPS